MRNERKKLLVVITLLLLVQIIFTSCTIDTKKEKGSEITMTSAVQLTPLSIEEGNEIYPKSYDDSQYSNNDLLLQSAYLSILNEYFLIHFKN